MSACACAGSSSGHGAPTSAIRCQPRDRGPDQPGVRQGHQRRARRRLGLQRGDDRARDRVPVVEQRHRPVGGQRRAEPAAHLGDRQRQARGGRPPGRAEQVGYVDQVAEHLAVVGRGTLVVAAVGQHLHGQLGGEPLQRPGEQPLVAQEHAEPGQRLEALDQVIAAHVGLEVAAEEPGVRRDLAQELRLQVAARDQVAVQAAPGPGPQRRGVGQPGVAAAESAGGLPGLPHCGEDAPRGAAVGLGGQAPGPVPVVQVIPPQLRRIGVLPRGWPAQVPDHPEERDPARYQLGEARPALRRDRVERREAGRPAARGDRTRAGQQPLADPRPPVQRGPLGAQPRPVRDLGRPQVHGGAAEQRKLLAVHAASPIARASARMPSANGRGA